MRRSYIAFFVQAEEAARKAEEEAALKVAEEAAKDPVKQVQASLAKGKPAATAALVKSLDVEGGPAGRMRVLYEVSCQPQPRLTGSQPSAVLLCSHRTDN